MRICTITNEPMVKGYVFNDGDVYCKFKKDAVNVARENYPEGTSDEDILDDLYGTGEMYYTEWDDAMVVGSLRVYSKEMQEKYLSILWGTPASLQEILTFIHSENFGVNPFSDEPTVTLPLDVTDIYDEIISGEDVEMTIFKNGIRYTLTLNKI